MQSPLTSQAKRDSTFSTAAGKCYQLCHPGLRSDLPWSHITHTRPLRGAESTAELGARGAGKSDLGPQSHSAHSRSPFTTRDSRRDWCRDIYWTFIYGAGPCESGSGTGVSSGLPGMPLVVTVAMKQCLKKGLGVTVGSFWQSTCGFRKGEGCPRDFTPGTSTKSPIFPDWQSGDVSSGPEKQCVWGRVGCAQNIMLLPIRVINSA